MAKILVIGSSGQIGTELVIGLRKTHGGEQVVASDIKPPMEEVLFGGPFEELDVLDSVHIKRIVEKHNIKEVYLLAALLSATAEKKIDLAWKINMNGLHQGLCLMA